MSVAIKYKGNSIAEMEESGTKTLNTSGKYCEDNFTIEYTAEEVGASDVRKWTVNVTGEISGVYATILTDSWLAEHRADENLCVVMLPNFVLPHTSGSNNQGVYLCTNKVRATDSAGVLYKSMSMYVHSNGAVNPRMRKYGLNNANDIGDLSITSAGVLRAISYGTYPLVAGEYTVMAFLT